MRARLAFALRRLTGAALTVLGVSLTVFLLRHAVPGDPIDAMLGENATEGQREELRRCLDMDKSLGGELLAFARDVGSGTLGISCVDMRTTVRAKVAAVYPRTIELALAAVALALVIALPLGTLAALRPGSWLDSAVMATSLLGIAVPTMWLGPLLLAYFYVRLGWFPGPADPPSAAGALVLPAFTLASHLAAMLARMTRSSLLDAAAEDYMRTARAKGLGRMQALVRHALRNALLPVVTVAGIQLGALLAGAIIVEKIFGRPGLGTLLLDSINVRDWKVVQGVVLVVAVSYVVVNLLVDLAYAALDPRIRVR
jgi:ABC-type dipeptide/oligopeptide/nickel transport system permease component